MAIAPPRRGKVGSLAVPPPGTVIPALENFLRVALVGWTTTNTDLRGQNENRLNACLQLYLEARARLDLPVVLFQHQTDQGSSRSADIGVFDADQIRVVGLSADRKPIYVIEGKLLPSPGSGRTTEYVRQDAPNNSARGGIQRFKLCLHGRELSDAAIVGYVVQYDANHWHGQINGWIQTSVTTNKKEKWKAADQLSPLDMSSPVPTAKSVHARPKSGTPVSPNISLTHFFVQL